MEQKEKGCANSPESSPKEKISSQRPEYQGVESATENKLAALTSFQFDNSCFEPIRKSDGGYGWIRYKHNQQQKIINSETFTYGDKKFTLQVPVFPKNVLSLATGYGKNQTSAELIRRIRQHLLRRFKFPSKISLNFTSIFILGSYLFDLYENVCYLIFTGPPGTGKTEIEDAIFDLSYKAFKGTGADSEASFLRSIDTVRGMLIVDEAQENTANKNTFVHKVFAVGAHRDGHVIKNVQKGDDWFPRAFSAYCPKVLGGRSVPGDEAIISRSFQVALPLRDSDDLSDLESNSSRMEQEANQLRNDLLLFRQRRLLKEIHAPEIKIERTIKLSGRENQVFEWLFSECPDTECFKFLEDAILETRTESKMDRRLTFEAQVLFATLRSLQCNKQLVADVSHLLEDRGQKTSSKAVARVLRENNIELRHERDGLNIISPLVAVESSIRRLGLDLPENSQSSQVSQNNNRNIEEA